MRESRPSDTQLRHWPDHCRGASGGGGSDAGLAELADRASEAVAGRSREAALAALGNAYRDYAREHPGRFAAMQLRLDSETAARSDGPRHTRMMRAILREYQLSEDDQTHAVRLLGSTFQGYVSLELSGSFNHSEPSSDESWERIIHGLHILLQNGQVRQPGASPTTPLLVVSPIHCPVHEQTPGPAAFDPEALAAGERVGGL